MNIIAGKQYVTACGLITPPLKKLAGFEEMFDVGFGNPLLWKKNGIYIGRHDDPMLNIVKEHLETGGSPVLTGVHTVPGYRETCVPRRGTKDGGFSFTR